MQAWRSFLVLVSLVSFSNVGCSQQPAAANPAPQSNAGPQVSGSDPLASPSQPGYPAGDQGQPPAPQAQPAPQVAPQGGQQPVVQPVQQPAPVGQQPVVQPVPVGQQPGVQPAPIGQQPVVQPVPQAGQPLPAVQPVPAPLLLPTAGEMPRIYNLMLATRRFENFVGHTVAASQLAVCLPGLTPEQKTERFMAMLSAMARSRLDVVREAYAVGIFDNPQVTMIAAVLSCKAGTRTAPLMVQALEASYIQVLRDFRLANELYQVEVAARLMQ